MIGKFDEKINQSNFKILPQLRSVDTKWTA